MPSFLYIALSIIPIGRAVGDIGMSYSTFLLPGLIAVSIMQMGIYGLSYWLVDMRSRGTLKRFAVTPFKKSDIIGGVLASRLIIIILQAFLLSLLGLVVFRANINLSFVNLLFSLLFILLGGSIFLLVGLIVAGFADTYEAAAPITATLALPMNFLAEIFYPLSLLPESLQYLARLLPMTYFAHALRSLYLEPFSFSLIALDLGVMSIWFFVLFAISVKHFRIY